jgi:hypothetical protein
MCRKSSEACLIVIYRDNEPFEWGRGGKCAHDVEAQPRSSGQHYCAQIGAQRAIRQEGGGRTTPFPQLQSPPSMSYRSHPIMKYVMRTKKAWPHPSKCHHLSASAPCIFLKSKSDQHIHSHTPPPCVPAISPTHVSLEHDNEVCM